MRTEITIGHLRSEGVDRHDTVVKPGHNSDVDTLQLNSSPTARGRCDNIGTGQRSRCSAGGRWIQGGCGGMAEPNSLVRLDAYREARQVATTWWERRDAELLARGAQGAVPSQEAEPDAARLRSVGIDDRLADPGQDSALEVPVESDRPAGPSTAFRDWSTAYVLRLALFDMFVGAMAVAIPSLNSARLGPQEPLIVTMSLLGAIVWPLAVAAARGYDRRRIGIGSDEMRSVIRAGMGLVLVGAFWAGLLGAEIFLKLAVVATPLAVTLSLVARFFARKQLHWRQRAGVNVRRVIVVGGWAAAKHLRDRLEAEPTSGMRILGACIPTRDIGYAQELGMPVLGNLGEVPSVVRKVNCDAVAVTSDDATRHHYLRRLAWSLEGSGVEMFVDPGLVEVAGPRMHIRPQVGLPLLHIE